MYHMLCIIIFNLSNPSRLLFNISKCIIHEEIIIIDGIYKHDK